MTLFVGNGPDVAIIVAVVIVVDVSDGSDCGLNLNEIGKMGNCPPKFLAL